MEIGKTYKFTHERKGTFIAQLIDLLPTPDGDPDQELWKVKIDTRKGSGQERLAQTAKAEITVVNLRPSLISQCEEAGDSEWLIAKTVKGELTPEQKAQKQYEADLERTVKKILDEAEKTKEKPGIFDTLLGRKQKKH